MSRGSVLRKSSHFVFLLCGVLVVFLGLLLMMSHKGHFSDSEIWSLSSSKSFFLTSYRPSFFYKPLFHLIWAPFFWIDLDSVQTLLASRGLSVSVVLLQVLLTFAIAKRYFDSTKLALFSCLLLVSSTLFLSRSFRLRSDLFASAFFYLQLMLLLSGAVLSRYQQTALSAIMLLFTPKALIYYFLLLLAQWQMGRKLTSVLKGQLPLALTFLVLLASALLFWETGPKSLYSAIDFFFNSFGSSFKESYFSEASYLHVLLFLQRNPIFALMLAASFFLGRGEKRPLFLTLSAISCVIIFLYPNKSPFFLVTFLPLFALAATRALNAISERWQNVVLLALSLALTFSGLKFGSQFLKNNSNERQLLAIEQLEQYITDNMPLVYYDSFGSIPQRPFFSAFIGHSQNNDYQLDLVFSAKPDLIFYTGKVALVGDKIRPFLTENYLHLGHDVYALAETLELRGFSQERGHWLVPLKNVSQKLKALGRNAEERYLNVADFEETYTQKLYLQSLSGDVTRFHPVEKLKKTVDEYEYLLIPIEYEKIKFSSFPAFRFHLPQGFNTLFLFDVQY